MVIALDNLQIKTGDKITTCNINFMKYFPAGIEK